MTRILVIAAVVQRGGKLLVCRRPMDKRHGGLWEFPGGKLEPGEDYTTAARRELKEELGLDLVSLGDAEMELQDPGSPFFISFIPAKAIGEPQCREHTAYAWGTPNELRRLPLAPSDKRYVDFVLEHQSDF